MLICDFLLAIINERLVETRNEKSLAFIIPRNGGRGGTPLYKLYRYVPPHRVEVWSGKGSGFGEPAAHPYQEFPGVPPGYNL